MGRIVVEFDNDEDRDDIVDRVEAMGLMYTFEYDK